MVSKHPISPQRIRKVPRQFSWVDHRLVRDNHIDRFDHWDGLLYLFLITVGDYRGLSYYGDSSIMKHLHMPPEILEESRKHLVDLGLIAWRQPLYQVLSLDDPPPVRRSAMDHPLDLGSIFRQMTGGER